MQQAVNTTREAVGKAADTVSDYASSAYGAVSSGVSSGLDYTGDTIRQYPGTSVTTALVVGLAIGFFLGVEYERSNSWSSRARDWYESQRRRIF